MNSKLTTWNDHSEQAENSSTPVVQCRVFKIDYSKPLPQPKKGRSLASFISDWEQDEEKAAALIEARAWTANEILDSQNGQTLKTLRLQKGLSQAQLATLMQTSQPHIARIEKGRDSVTLDTLSKLSESLGADYNTLVAAIKLQEKIISDENRS